MNNDPPLGYFRDILKLAGSSIVARGVLTEDELTAGLGALVALLGVLWSGWRRWQRARPGEAPLPSAGAARLNSFLGLALAAALLLPATACRTPGDGQAIAIVSTLAGQAARIDVTADVRAHPEHRVAYEATILALDGLRNAENYDPAALQSILAQLPYKKLQGADSALIIEGGVLVYSALTATLFDVQSRPAVAALLLSLRNGLAAGLQAGGTRSLAPPPATDWPIAPTQRRRI